MTARWRLLVLGVLGLTALGTAGVAVHARTAQGTAEQRVEVGEQEPLTPAHDASTGHCGVERWSVKTGTDADSAKVDVNATTNTTIASRTALPAPGTLPSNSRLAPVETTVYGLDAILTEFKLEQDSDYHLVITDGSGHTMISEIPDPACVGASSPFLSSIRSARATFDAMFTATTFFQQTHTAVHLRGVGFFDFLHGQTGVAPNGVEIHPVLGVTFGVAPTPGPTG